MAGENVKINIYESGSFVFIVEGISAYVISWKAIVAIELKVLQILVGVRKQMQIAAIGC